MFALSCRPSTVSRGNIELPCSRNGRECEPGTAPLSSCAQGTERRHCLPAVATPTAGLVSKGCEHAKHNYQANAEGGRRERLRMLWIIGIGLTELAGVVVVLGVIALRNCEPEDIPDTLRALARFVGHPDHQVRGPVRERRRLGPGTGPPHRHDSRRPPRGRAAVRGQHRRAKH